MDPSAPRLSLLCSLMGYAKAACLSLMQQERRPGAYAAFECSPEALSIIALLYS